MIGKMQSLPQYLVKKWVWPFGWMIHRETAGIKGTFRILTASEEATKQETLPSCPPMIMYGLW